MPKRNFEKILLEAVDEGLSSLGVSSKEAIYFHLEKSFNIKKEEIPYKIKTFSKAIGEIFGLGANFLEILIMKRLYEKIGGTFEWHEPTEFAFSEYVNVTKQNFSEKNRIKATKIWVECGKIEAEA